VPSSRSTSIVQSRFIPCNLCHFSSSAHTQFHYRKICLSYRPKLLFASAFPMAKPILRKGKMSPENFWYCPNTCNYRLIQYRDGLFLLSWDQYLNVEMGCCTCICYHSHSITRPKLNSFEQKTYLHAERGFVECSTHSLSEKWEVSWSVEIWVARDDWWERETEREREWRCIRSAPGISTNNCTVTQFTTSETHVVHPVGKDIFSCSERAMNQFIFQLIGVGISSKGAVHHELNESVC
jgi:hypothetical protein